jgi:ADP-heptose:LPS heptosyltransferase
MTGDHREWTGKDMPQDSPQVLIVRLDAIGDALALTPLLLALRERDIPVDLLLSERNLDAFSARAARRRFTDPNAVVAGSYSHVLVATEDASGYRIAKASGAGHRIGFVNGWGKPLKTLWARSLLTSEKFRAAGLDARAPHESAVLFELGRELLGDTAPSHDATLLAPLVLDNVPPRGTNVVLQVTDKWERLGIPLADVALVARATHARAVGAASETSALVRFADAGGGAVERFESLVPWKDAIASAAVVIAPDSGALHVAGMTGTPCVAVFPPTGDFALQTARWSPWAAPHRIVEASSGWPERVVAAVTALRSRDADRA